MGEVQQRILYSREEAAKLLSISVRTLHTYEAKGLIRAKRTEGRVLFSRKELERFADNVNPIEPQGRPEMKVAS